MNIRSSFVKLLFSITVNSKTESHFMNFRNSKITLCFRKLFLCFMEIFLCFIRLFLCFLKTKRRSGLENGVYKIAYIAYRTFTTRISILLSSIALCVYTLLRLSSSVSGLSLLLSNFPNGICMI